MTNIVLCGNRQELGGVPYINFDKDFETLQKIYVFGRLLLTDSGNYGTSALRDPGRLVARARGASRGGGEWSERKPKASACFSETQQHFSRIFNTILNKAIEFGSIRFEDCVIESYVNTTV
ncbi:hypothetical protein KIN20_009962 [Parelaphostrongylus tenuis]|uniref:Uncharacterized protein n=1 Tax=Parelaphostrongylus tenuis TaxID=148309 RepID=A0AAD5QK04_PARTN|nr:hypothetical protein KIN20_009962 [Parelaphostrongylus tenuis]